MKLAQGGRIQATLLQMYLFQFLSWHLIPFYELDSDRPVGEEQRVVDLVHSLADRVLEAVAAEDGGEQHVEVLLGESAR